LRRQLLADREAFAASPQAPQAQRALTAHLQRLLDDLEPGLLGLYAPVRGEFNAIEALEGRRGAKLQLALPFAQRQPPTMHYRAWDGAPLAGVDECGLPAPAGGPAVIPDVVLVPCVAFTRSGYRLGYGGGFFDRWLAQHPGVTAVGIAWSRAEVDEARFAPQAHDRPLALMLTERGVAL
jgi:5,10-methenyltetrahydrofolate synthetase